MTRTLTLAEARARLSRLAGTTGRREDKIVLTRKGKPAAIILNYGTYESLLETLDVLSDREGMAQLRRSERYFARGGKGKTIDEVFGNKE